MTLAGTSFIGDTAAAVIILRDPRPGTGANGTGANSAEISAAELQRQLRLATANRDELNSLLRTLQQTPGATKEQIDSAAERLERSKEKLQRLEKHLIERRMGVDIKGKVVDEDGGYRKDHPFDGKPIDYLEYEKIEKVERKILTEQNKKVFSVSSLRPARGQVDYALKKSISALFTQTS